MKHSAKAREKLADALMKLSNSLASALFKSLLVVPLGGLLISLVKGEHLDLLGVASRLSPTTALVFLVLYALNVCAVMGGRAAAMKIYDDLARTA